MLFNGDGLRLQARLITSPLNKEYIEGKFPDEKMQDSDAFYQCVTNRQTDQPTDRHSLL